MEGESFARFYERYAERCLIDGANHMAGIIGLDEADTPAPAGRALPLRELVRASCACGNEVDVEIYYGEVLPLCNKCGERMQWREIADTPAVVPVKEQL